MQVTDLDGSDIDGEFYPFQYLCVTDFDQPIDVWEISEGVLVKLIQLLDMVCVGGPSFTSVQRCGDN